MTDEVLEANEFIEWFKFVKARENDDKYTTTK